MSEEYTGRVAATVIPRTSEEQYFLVAKRIDSGEWEFPGGKEHVGEDLTSTAEREIDEEFSLEIRAQKVSTDCSWMGGGYDIVPVYAGHNYADLDEEIQQDLMTDHSEYAWIDTDDLGESLENAREKLGEEIKGLKAFNLL